MGPTQMTRNTIAVGLGGIIGAIARYGVSLGLNPSPNPTGFPWGTLLCNLSGCLLLGWLAALGEHRLSPRLRLSMTTGAIGAFTTFSTFSVEMLNLLQNGRPIAALLYIAISGVGGLALTGVGSKLGGMHS